MSPSCFQLSATNVVARCISLESGNSVSAPFSASHGGDYLTFGGIHHYIHNFNRWYQRCQPATPTLNKAIFLLLMSSCAIPNCTVEYSKSQVFLIFVQLKNKKKCNINFKRIKQGRCENTPLVKTQRRASYKTSHFIC